MSASGDEEVFDTGASPVLRSPELRRSSRTTSRKRASTGSVPYSRPRSKKKMQTVRSPPAAAAGAATPGPQESPATPVTPATPAMGGQQPNPFAQLGTGSGPAQAGGQGDILASMREMMGGMLGSMECRLNRASDDLRTSVTGQIGQVAQSVADLGGRVSANERRMDNLENMIEKKIEEGFIKHTQNAPVLADNEFPSLTVPVGQILSTSNESSISSYATALSSGSRTTAQPEERKERDYWISRKSLRLRPIDCLASESRSAVRDFMLDNLKMDRSTVDSLGEFAVSLVPHGPKTKHKKEAIVRFHTVEARDIVRGSAANLAGSGPDVGVRLEVPNHLRPAMKALQSLSYNLKQKHTGARRNVLFDDDSLNLVLDFSLGDGQPWKRVTAEQARKRSSNPSSGFRVGEGELDDILDPK